MPDDIRLKVGLFTHHKTKRLIRRLGHEGGYRLLQLFAWAAVNRPDGDLAGMTKEDIEAAVDWSGEIGAFAAALVDVGFLDGAERGYSIHDWAEHNPWAASAEDRSEAGKWAALCRRYGRSGAAARMPEYAERMRTASEAHADGMRVAERRTAGRREAHCPDTNPVPDSDTNPDSDTDSDSDTNPSGRVAAPLALAPPPAQRPRKAGAPSKTGPAWSAYAAAYAERYGVEPVRNAKSSALLGQLVDRIGAEDAPHVAAFYVRHNSAYYVQRGHALQCLVADAEKLRTEWATGRKITVTQARLEDRTASNAFAQMLAERRGGKVQ